MTNRVMYSMAACLRRQTFCPPQALQCQFKALRDAIVEFAQTEVHEIRYSECNKSYVLHGGKDYQAKQIQEMLGLSSSIAAIHS